MKKALSLAAIVLAAGISLGSETEQQKFYPVPMVADSFDGRSDSFTLDLVNEKYVEQAMPKSDIHGGQRGDNPWYWPMKPKGVREIIYYIVDFSDKSVTTTKDDIQDTMDFLGQEYFPNQSHGALSINMTYGGRQQIPFTNTDECDTGDMYEWAQWVDSHYIYSEFLPFFDSRVYIFPDPGQCPFAGYATTHSNPNLPNHDGFANQAFLFVFNAYVAGHELGHNFDLDHSNDLEQGEYGDPADIMGRIACDTNPEPICEDNPVGLHGEHRARLGWLARDIETIIDDGFYTIAASELSQSELLDREQSEDAQLLRIVSPFVDEKSMYLEYRTGLDNPDVILHPDFAYGLSMRESRTDNTVRTLHFETLEQGETGSPYPYFEATLIEKTDTQLLIYLAFQNQPGTESWLTPGSCTDNINNDYDFSCDYTGCEGLPPEKSCVFPWEDMNAKNMILGQSQDITCISTEAGQEGFGPVGEGLGTIQVNGINYSASFTPTSCGTRELACGTTLEGAITETFTRTIEVGCRPQYACNTSGDCVPRYIQMPVQSHVE